MQREWESSSGGVVAKAPQPPANGYDPFGIEGLAIEWQDTISGDYNARMNEELWSKGIVENINGRVAWPGMKKSDAEHLPPVEFYNGLSDSVFRIDDILVAETPFIGQIYFKRPSTIVNLEIEADHSRKLHGKEFPGAEDLAYFEFLFEAFLGNASRRQKRSWGEIGIALAPWTNDPSIFLAYKG